MRRKPLILLLVAPLLLVVFLFHLAQVQAAPAAQADATPDALAAPGQPAVDPGVDAGVPLSQPLRIRIRQQVPITIALALLRPVTTTLSPTGSLEFTGLTPITGTVSRSSLLGSNATATPTAAVARATPTRTPTRTPTATPTVDAVTPITGATVITGLLPITSGLSLTGAVPLTIGLQVTTALPLTGPGADATLLSDTLTPTTGATATEELLAVPAVPVAVPTGTLTSDLLEAITGTLSVTQPAVLLAAGDVLTSVPAIFTGVGITMDLDLQILITDTGASIVPAVLVLRFGDMPTMTLPVSITVNAPSTATVFVEPVNATEDLTLTQVVTLTPPLTATVEPTVTLEVTPAGTPTATATPVDINALAVVTVTTPVTANIRANPAVDAEIVSTVPPNTILPVVAQNAAGDWLLLQDGNWIAVVVFGAAPAGLPTATDELVAALREAAANATPTPTPLPPTPTPTATPTPPPPPFTPVTVTTTTNANLRAGPGTNFDVVGNTTVGQAVVVSARDATGAWLLLNTNQWISAQLVNGLPEIATIPVFDPNATPTPPAIVPTATSPAPTTPLTGTTPITGTPAGPLLPTATPNAAAAPTPAVTPTPATLSVDENVYLVEFDNITANYQRALTAIDRLVDSASGSTAVFSDAQWLTDMNTAIQLLRNAGASVERLSAPERFAAAHNSLRSSGAEYNAAADLLAAGVQGADAAQFDQAFAAIQRGDALLAQASAALSAYRP